MTGVRTPRPFALNWLIGGVVHVVALDWGSAMARRLTPCALPVLLLALTACSPAIETGPFTEFSTAAREIRDGTDAALQQSEAASRERTIAGAVADLSGGDAELREDALLGLVLSFEEGKPYGWSDADLPYLATARFRKSVHELNDAFFEYADLLSALARATPLSAASVDSMATAVNAGTRRVLDGLSVSSADQTSGLIAATAATGFEEFIRSRKKQQLRQAIADNQSTIVAFSAHMAEACELAALDLRQSYLSAVDVLVVAIEKAVGTTRLPARVEDLLDANDEFKARLGALRDIGANYRAIGAAHHELVETLDDADASTESIRQLFEQAERLRVRYEGTLP